MTVDNILITGITGQDGIFLTSHLLNLGKKFNIFGISRGNEKTFFKNLNSINTKSNIDKIKLVGIDLKNTFEVTNLISDINPVQIYNLTGPSSVYESISKPELYKEVIPLYFNNLTNACIKLGIFPTFFQASSSEMFSIKNRVPLNENSQFNPRNPYSLAKYKVFQEVNNLKNNYEWNIKTGIMFNHESEFRDIGYLFTKIIDTAISIKNGEKKILKVGSLTYVRDWSYAGDVAEAISLISEYSDSKDFVIGSGIGTSIEEVLDMTFSQLGLDYRKFTEVDPSLLRDGDPEIIFSDPTNLKDKLGWTPKVDVEKLIQKCISFKAI
jgi:GDPmannose 4,6-dehydratase